jgi:beta-D-xylosidase 4
MVLAGDAIFCPTGEMGGDAIASILAGDVSPSGRLTTTVYHADYIYQRNITDMVMRPHGAVPGITYRFLEQEPLWEFGFGRSYTSFSFAMMGASEHSVQTTDVQAAFARYFAVRGTEPPHESLSFKVAVTNTGGVASDVVTLCFVSASSATAPQQQADAPLRQLAGFQRISDLSPGENHTVVIGLAPTALTTVSKDGAEKVSAGKWFVRCGGAPDGFTTGVLHITGRDVETFALPASSASDDI